MKWMSLFLTLIALKSCGSNDSSIKITIKPNANTFVHGDTLNLSLRHKKGLTIDSTQYFLNGQVLALPYVFVNEKLGDQQLKAINYIAGETTVASRTVRLLKATPPELWTYNLLNEYPHDQEAYTQGLEFDGEILYESTGLNKKSSLRKVDYTTGKITQSIPLDDSYFGEGLTLLSDKVYQLTWQSNTGFIYDKESLTMESSFPFDQSKEGWGLCNDGEFLYKSDGTAKIWKLDPTTGKELSYVEVTTHKTILTNINELEWVNGKIFANTYQFQKEVILIINPSTGAVEGVVDLKGLKSKVAQIPSLNVLNGIAYHLQRKSFFITGKNWSKLFEVTLQKK